MKSITLEIYSDFVCPFCFLAEKPLIQAIDALSQEININLTWKPFELRPSPTPTLKPEGEYLSRVWKELVYPMALRMQTDIILPKVSPQPYTGLAFEGAIYAALNGKSPEYQHRMFTAFFQGQLNIWEIDILSRCAADIGLDKQDFRSALENGLHAKSYEEQLLYVQQQEVIKTVPTYIFPNGFRISGVLEREKVLALMLNQFGLM